MGITLRQRIVDAIQTQWNVTTYADPQLASLANNEPIHLVRYIGIQGRTPNRAHMCTVEVVTSGARNSQYQDGQGIEEHITKLLNVLAQTTGLYPNKQSVTVTYTDGLNSLVEPVIGGRFIAAALIVEGDPVL